MNRIASLTVALACTLGFGAAGASPQAASAPAAAAKKKCGKGELGGVVATNKKVGKEFVTTIKGDKTPLRTPEAAGDVYTTVSKLQPGDLYCYKDDGS